LPWIEQNDNRIFYSRLDEAEKRSDNDASGATPIVLQHGLAQWSDDWVRAGWIDAFGDRPVYAIDALGHGRSDRPAEREAYSVEARAEAVLKLADAAQLNRFIFFGFSMGGRVGFELAVSQPSMVERLIVGGMHALKPSIDGHNLERRVSVLRSSKWRLVERAVGARPDDGRNNDSTALALSTEAVLDWEGAESRLPDLKLPVLLYFGAQDSLLEYAERTAELIPGCSFVNLPSTTHAASFYSSDSARQHVQDFLAAGAN
jgi:pimeloyl-ACP methyl ester carboxylesterase